MLIIRLKRIGKKKFPTYRLIISEKTKDTWGSNLEELGSYNPHIFGKKLLAKMDRIKYWIAKGAQMSSTVNNLLVSAGLIEGKKKKSVYLSKKRKIKLDEKSKVKAEAEAKKQEQLAVEQAKVEAPAEEIPAEAPVEQAPAIETPAEAEPAPVEEAPGQTDATVEPQAEPVEVVLEQKDKPENITPIA